MDQVLLGSFNRYVGYEYQEMLEDAGVEVFVVDTVNQFEKNRSFVNIQLFVARQDQLKAERLIRDSEYKTALKFKELSTVYDLKMLAFFLLFIIAFFLYVIWANQSYWSLPLQGIKGSQY